MIVAIGLLLAAVGQWAGDRTIRKILKYVGMLIALGAILTVIGL